MEDGAREELEADTNIVHGAIAREVRVAVHFGLIGGRRWERIGPKVIEHSEGFSFRPRPGDATAGFTMVRRLSFTMFRTPMGKCS